MGEVSANAAVMAAWCRAAISMTVLAARVEAGERAYGSRGHRLAPVPCNSRFVGGATMPTYRICTVGSDGSLIAGEDIECADDQEAIEKASQAAKDSGIELWQRDRCVIQLLPAPSPNWNFPSVDSDEGSDEL